MPSKWVTNKSSIVNNTCVFGSMPGTGLQTGRNVLEMRPNVGYPNNDPFNSAHRNQSCGVQLSLLKTGSKFGIPYWNRNKITGGVGRNASRFQSGLRW